MSVLNKNPRRKDIYCLCSTAMPPVKKLFKIHCKIRRLKPVKGFVGAWFLIFFLLGMSSVYLYLHSRFQRDVDVSEIPETREELGTCDFSEGRWIRDETYPLYNASECPFAERGFDCLSNGRRDRGFTKWRWEPTDCDVRRFNPLETLEMLRGKRVVFVGDSLSRTQWESMVCMLFTGVDDKKSVYEVNGNEITKRIRYLGVRFSSYNMSIEFYRSVFLVQPASVPRHAPRKVKSTLVLDMLDQISKEWIDSDVLVFNSGHWWNPTKLFEMGCYFQRGGSLKLGMTIASAFRTALHTWATWVEANINTNRTAVFFRTFESSHWSGRGRSSCRLTRRPSQTTRGREESYISEIINDVIGKMSAPVRVLHVTPMGAFRSDAHLGTWSDHPSVQDCSHWCLPGVPDAWNELLFSYLRSSSQRKNGNPQLGISS